MIGIENLWLFLISGLALNLTPGADMLYVIDRTIARGTRNGIVASAGIAAGCLVHIVFAAIGVTALLAASPASLTILKVIGAAYLLWLGVTLIRSDLFEQLRSPANDSSTAIQQANDFLKGVAINVLNPKIALFFIAFLPQFISQDATSPVATLVTLGVIFNVVGTFTLFIVVWAARTIRLTLKTKSPLLDWYPRLVGALMLALGVRLALTTV